MTEKETSNEHIFYKNDMFIKDRIKSVYREIEDMQQVDMQMQKLLKIYNKQDPLTLEKITVIEEQRKLIAELVESLYKQLHELQEVPLF